MTAARPGQFTGATDNAADGGLFTDTLIDGIPDLVGADVLAAQTAATNAATSETNAANSETAAATSETNAATSATNAATSATNAATSAASAAADVASIGTSVSDAAASATAAATSATNAATSETAAAGSATSASSSATSATASANTAVTSASAAGTSATNAATSETNSANSAAASATSATASANSATASANSATVAQTAQTAAELAETNAETAETNAETAETNAASSASAAASSASAASTSETNAATSATNSANSATASANSATASANSATAAAASEAAAAGYVDEFDDKYLGAKASDPTVDNDGDPLTDGALYYNTTDNRMKVYDLGTTTWLFLAPTNAEQTNINTVANDITNVNTVATNITDVNSFADTYFISATAPASPTTGDLWFDTANSIMKVYDGSGFVNAGSSVNGTSARYNYTATAGQTTFAAVYDTGYVDVYLNGVKLAPADFTATNGSSIVLTSGAALNDTVAIVGYGTFSLASAIALPDNVKATFGDSADLQIYHDGSDSWISDAAGLGNLYIRSNDLIIMNAPNNETLLRASQDGAVTAYYNGLEKLATTATGVGVTGANINFASSENGILNVFSNDATAVDKGGSISLGGNSESGSLGFAMIKGAKESTDAGYLAFGTRSAAANSTERMRILSNGNVGIGTASADSLLELYKAGTSELMIGSDNAGTAQLSFYEGNSGTKEGFLKYDGANNNVVLGTSGAANAVVVARDTGNVGINTTTMDAGLNIKQSADNAYQIKLEQVNATDGYGLICDMSDGDLAFSRYASSAYTERMRITAAGAVGIGTQSPSQKLTVEGTANNQNSEIKITASGVASGYLGSNSDGLNIGTDSHGIVFKTGVTGGGSVGATGSERLRIDSSGNVGINASAPASLLEVKASALNRANGIALRGSGANDVLYMYPSADNVATIEHLINGTTNTGGVLAINPQGGNVLLGTASSYGVGTTFAPQGSNGTLAVFNQNYGNGFTSHQFRYNGSAVGSIVINTSSTAYNTSSDHRLKENVTAITSATDRLNQLNPVRFNFIADADTTVDGFIAHEVATVIPEAISGEKDAVDDDGNPVYQGIDQSKLVPLLTAALQEALTKIDQLETRITALEV